MLARLIRDKKAATAIEYAMIAALISIIAIASFQALGLSLANIFDTARNGMSRY